MVRAISAFLEVCYLRFRFHRQIFQDSGVRPTGFSLPRHIRQCAAPNGLCSSITEAKHIKAVKETWRRSNRFEPLESDAEQPELRGLLVACARLFFSLFGDEPDADRCGCGHGHVEGHPGLQH